MDVVECNLGYDDTGKQLPHYFIPTRETFNEA